MGTTGTIEKTRPQSPTDQTTTPQPDSHELFASLRAPLSAEALDLSLSLRTPMQFEADHVERDNQHSIVSPSEHEATPRSGARSKRVTRQLAEIGAYRPAIRIPGRAERSTAHDGQARRITLPPVWLLANLVILLVAGLAVVPRVVAVDAAAGCNWYTVRAGDTLGNLGVTYRSTALKLAAANHITNPNLIYVGERLCIPTTANAAAPSAPKSPHTSSPPNFGTASGVKSFVAFVLPYARTAHQQTGWPTSMILAQWGLEQGWHTPTYTGYNFGNCGAIPGEPTVAGLNVPGSPSAFSYARTPADGLRQYIHVAHLSYYKAVAPTAASDGVDAAARALGRSPWDAGHYTATGNPGSSLVSILHTYNLAYYDSH